MTDLGLIYFVKNEENEKAHLSAILAILKISSNEGILILNQK